MHPNVLYMKRKDKININKGKVYVLGIVTGLGLGYMLFVLYTLL